MKRTMCAAARRRNAPWGRRKTVEECAIPDELNREAVWKAYMLHKSQCLLHCVPNPRTKNCRDNPYCLERLGSEKWEKLLQKMEKEGKTSEKSNNRREVSTMPCGLVNLGNSCYLNSFLQIFFSDPVFRRCIYEWRPVKNFVKPECEKINVEELMLCLQKLFVTLQITPYEDTSAEALANLLKLDDEQHDALEFQILLFGKMEKLLSYREEWKDVKNAIMNRFKGVITQTISCKKCGMARASELPFNPLYLVIDKVKSLSKAIETCFSPEKLSDYKCECGHAGFAEKCLTVKEPPPVVTIQLNRFTFDAAGHKKKVQSALQYPRVLEMCGVTYDICAVMIHEGPNADCGHYYDLIKHPVSRQWFTYNDAHVIPSVTPGVSIEKERISKVTPDMKGCYALVYRRRSEADEEVPEVPEHIEEMVALKLEEEFLAQTSATTESQQKWASVLKGHHERIKELWSALQVKDGLSMISHPEEIVFLPTKLLSEVQSKELEAVAEKKDELEPVKKRAKEDEGKAEKENGTIDGTALYKMSAIGSSLYSLCNHGRISLECVRGGIIKAVNKSAAEELLKRYSVQVASSSSTSQQQVLNNGADICMACVEDLKRESEFVATVEMKERLARQLLRERTKRYYHSDDCFWISVRSLQQYRKLVTRAREEQQKPAVDSIDITFTGPQGVDPELKCNVEVVPECKPSTSQMECKTDSDGEMANQCNEFRLPDMAASALDVSSTKKPSERFMHRMVPTKKRRIEANAVEARKCVHPDVVVRISEGTLARDVSGTVLTERREANVSVTVKDTQRNDLGNSSIRFQCDRTTRNIGSNGYDDGGEGPLSPGSVFSDKICLSGDVNASECMEVDGEAENGLNGDESTSLCSRPKSRSTRDDGDDETSDYNDENDDRRPVLFNGELKCAHGKFDYESSVVNERRIVVDAIEWQTLVEGMFDVHQLFTLPTDQLPCSDCELVYNCMQTDREGRQRRVQEIRASIGELIRNISRRRGAPPNGHQVYARVICGTFLKNLLSTFKSGSTRDVSTPVICQECILCDEHRLPCVALNADSLAVPVTLEEWKKIIAALEQNEEDVFKIVLNEDGYELFCQPCFERKREQEDLQRFIFKAGEIYVKLKNDENEQPQKVNGEYELNGGDGMQLSSIRNAPHATTRRAIAKSCMRFRMASTDTVMTLKLKIYEKIGQMPNDQLIYKNGQLLCDTETLGQARIDPHELAVRPLTLIVQYVGDIQAEPRRLERGFADTALSHD